MSLQIEEDDTFFLNQLLCSKAKEILSIINLPLLDYHSLVVDYEDLSIIDQLHSSSQLTTYKAFYKQKIVLAEVYHFLSEDGKSASDVNQIELIDPKVQLLVELSIMKTLTHESLVQLLGVGYFQYRIDLPNEVLVLSEYYEEDLQSVMKLETEEGFPSSWKEKMTWLREISSGLLLLEKYQLLVRDLSPQSILLTNQIKVKMRLHYDLQPLLSSSIAAMNQSDNEMKTTANESPPSLSSFQQTISSFGRIIFFLITGQPFADSFPIMEGISLSELQSVPVSDGCPESLRQLMIHCLMYHPSIMKDPNVFSESTSVTIPSLWKQLDQIWTLSFPNESRANQLLRRSSSSSTVTSPQPLRRQSSIRKAKANPFDDSEEDECKERLPEDSEGVQRLSSRRTSSASGLLRRLSSKSMADPYDYKPRNSFLMDSRAATTAQPIIPGRDRDQAIHSLVDTLGKQLSTVEIHLQEQLENIENLYIIEETQPLHLMEPKSQSNIRWNRKAIEKYFQQLENIKKQLVFLYLYCDLEGDTELLVEPSQTSEGPPLLPPSSDQKGLQQLLQEILGNDESLTEGIATTPEHTVYSFYRRHSQSLPPPEMKRRLSQLRRESLQISTPTVSTTTLSSRQPSHLQFNKMEDQLDSLKEDLKTINQSISSHPPYPAQEMKQMKRETSTSLLSSLPGEDTTSTAADQAMPERNKSITQRKSLKEIESERMTDLSQPLPPHKPSLHERLFNESGSGSPSTPTMQPSQTDRPTTVMKSGAVRRTSSFEDLIQFNNRRKSVSATTSSSAAATQAKANSQSLTSPGTTTAGPSTNNKIPNLIVGRKNSLVAIDNKQVADFHQRKMSLYRGAPAGGEGGHELPSMASQSSDLSTQHNVGPYVDSPMNKIFSNDLFSSPDPPLDEDERHPFAATTIPFTQKNDHMSSAMAASSPLRFIHGRPIHPNDSMKTATNTSSSAPLQTMTKTPIDKASEFINRVKQLDAMYLTRSQDPYEVPISPSDANVSYLHNNTFTGAMATTSSLTAGSTATNQKQTLTKALTSFLKVIEKCQDSSIKAKQLVHHMDSGISQISATAAAGPSRDRSVSPNGSQRLPRHMSPTYSSIRKVSPSALSSQKSDSGLPAASRALSNSSVIASTFTPSTVPAANAIRRPLSPASSVTSSNSRKKAGIGRNFFDNDDPQPLSNSFQSLYNLNQGGATRTLASNASILSSASSSSPTKKRRDARSKSPKGPSAIPKESLSTNKSPITYSFGATTGRK